MQSLTGLKQTFEKLPESSMPTVGGTILIYVDLVV